MLMGSGSLQVSQLAGKQPLKRWKENSEQLDLICQAGSTESEPMVYFSFTLKHRKTLLGQGKKLCVKISLTRIQRCLRQNSLENIPP